ncbi:oxygen-insensitive NAD(P)H nitroreductase [Candidatus Pantoea deserta]|uniref:Oxygen-insensitive NAD(P)H nitroreductase n=1 Tax=Candidatus Pantoea deserta TaxID=1869313 RepID=A0A3N4NFQ1_9GAMM|nr:oxygen-insensitive NAD(P)H nitroreductase [Pantoea deserta]RPD94235.1 oxygen-insensitive NAD(P)H nitroreductase [Pantoea deserta]
MTLSEAVATRHTVKAFDNTHTLSQSQIETLLHMLQNTPSSVNSQPWHFVIASTEAGKQAISAATSDAFSYNAPKVLNASHVIALCMRADLSEDHLQNILAHEEQAGRFRDASAKAGQDKSRRSYVDLHRYVLRDLSQWMEKQVYIALGGLLLSAALMEIDATPMEGFDTAALDKALGLREKGLTSVVLVSLGYRSEEDFNATLPKSRLPREEIFTFI